MKKPRIATLGYALLGLLEMKPASGYEVRKLFSETPMGGYSDSPGAIYPALRRLEEDKLIVGRVVSGAGLRQSKVFRITPAGKAALTRWLTGPIRAEDVAYRLSELMLRFSYLERAAGRAATLAFLRSFEGELKAYLTTLKKFAHDHAATMPVSGRLALENGMLGYEAQLAWASRAIHVYRKMEKEK